MRQNFNYLLYNLLYNLPTWETNLGETQTKQKRVYINICMTFDYFP